MSKTVQLKFNCVMQILGSDEIGVISLSDELGERQLNIPCDKHMLYEFGLRNSFDGETSRLLPECLWDIISQLADGSSFYVLIHGIEDGRYHCLLLSDVEAISVPVRVSDGILLSQVAHIPLIMDADLFMAQSQPAPQSGNAVTLPINSISSSLLSKALDKAVEDENYELASRLRDEIDRRQKQKGDSQ